MASALRGLDRRITDAVSLVGPWLTGGELELEPDGDDARQRRWLALDVLGRPAAASEPDRKERAVQWAAAVEVLLLALQVQLDLDRTEGRGARGTDRSLIDGDLLLARALAMAADLGARELALLAGMLEEISLSAVTASLADGRQPSPDEMVNDELVSRVAARFTVLASERGPIEEEPAVLTRPAPPAPDGRGSGWGPEIESLLAGPLAQDLSRVEAALVDLLAVPGQPLVTEAMTYIATAGGKRLRPLLVLLGQYAGQKGELRGADEETVRIAASIEALHLHTLYHDDVIDGASTRRGMPTAVERWGKQMAIGVGNALCARAFALAARSGQASGQLMAASYQEICRGQSRELAQLFDLRRSQRDYFISIGGKTAFLLGIAARFGAMSSGEPSDDLLDDLWATAFNYGMAFQVIDDLLDILGHEAQLKKPVGTDVTEGVYTLPILLAIQEAPELRELLAAPPTRAQIEELRMRLAATQAVVASVRYAIDRCTAAKQILTESPDVHPEIRRALMSFDEVMLAPLVAAGVDVGR